MFQESFNGTFKKKVQSDLGLSQERVSHHLENVSVYFGKIAALQNVHLKIERGEIVFITGVSGAGKTTLLKILAGEQEINSGRMTISPQLQKKKLFVSNIFQDLRLISDESCEKNILQAYDRNIYKNKNEFYRDLQEFSRLLGIDDRLHLKIRHANGGLKQKIAFVRSMLARPNILLADEPTASLDYDNAKKIYDILNIYNIKKNLTVVWASHNKDLIKKFPGRIVHLEKGKLVYSGHACFI